MKVKNSDATQTVSPRDNSDYCDSKSMLLDSFLPMSIQNWLVFHASKLLSIEANEIDCTTSLEQYGLDSVAAISLVSDLSTYIGYELPPELILDYPSIQALTQYCSEIEETTL